MNKERTKGEGQRHQPHVRGPDPEDPDVPGGVFGSPTWLTIGFMVFQPDF